MLFLLSLFTRECDRSCDTQPLWGRLCLPFLPIKDRGCDRSCDAQSRLSELVGMKDHLWKCSLGAMQVDKEDSDMRLQPRSDASDNTPSPPFLLKGGWVGSSLDLSFGAFGSEGMDPWRVLSGPLRLPWETGFFREVMNSDRNVVDSAEDLGEAAQRRTLVTAPLPPETRPETTDSTIGDEQPVIRFEPGAAFRAQEKG